MTHFLQTSLEVCEGQQWDMEFQDRDMVSSEEYVNMIEVGIVDPTKVTRSALQNAASAASMVLTTESVVAEKSENESPMPGGMPGMGGMPMM